MLLVNIYAVKKLMNYFFRRKEHMNSKDRNRRGKKLKLDKNTGIEKSQELIGHKSGEVPETIVWMSCGKNTGIMHKEEENKHEVNSCNGNISFTWIRHFVGSNQ